MRRAELLAVFLAAAALASGQGCAAGQDKKSRELVAVTRLARTPAGSLSVSDDGRYEFVNFASKRAHDGELSSGELATLNRHLASPRLDAVYEARDSDPTRCERDEAGLVLHSRLGTACFVATDTAAPAVRESLEFFATLFAARATERR
jgi:hypothetical protein